MWSTPPVVVLNAEYDEPEDQAFAESEGFTVFYVQDLYQDHSALKALFS